MTTTIGAVYFEGKYYVGEEACTVGAPGLSPQVFMNRRTLQGRLTPEGEDKLQEVKDKFLTKYGLKVFAKFDRYAGCKMCPCSPGYTLFVEASPRERSKEEYRFDIWVQENGSLNFREPKEISWFNQLVVPEKQDRLWKVYVLIDEKNNHKKFWSISGKFTAWGRIGTRGQIQENDFYQHDKEAQKIKEGYELVDEKSKTYYPRGI